MKHTFEKSSIRACFPMRSWKADWVELEDPFDWIIRPVHAGS
ncbi:hypothetical protein [Salicibibacter cibi]|nr:hypothetical protein [Salicibibacter cibi]